MPLFSLTFRPGINRDVSNYSGEGGWFECDKVRFRQGLPQKLGGWTKLTPMPFIGVCRQLWEWVTTFGDQLLAVATDKKVYINSGGNYFDITPLRETSPTLITPITDNAIGVTSGLTTVVVTLSSAHGASTGDYVVISGVAGPIGGVPAADININTSITVLTATTFSFEAATTASSTVSGAGGTAISISFEIPVGAAAGASGVGWGIGTWSRDEWGLGAETGTFVLPQRDWWTDNFDNDLVLNIRNGPGYWWVRGAFNNPSLSLSTKAISLVDYADGEGFDGTAVPVKIGQLLVSQQDKHLLAFGAVPFGSTDEDDFDPLLIRWASQDQPGQWFPSDINSAGDLRVSRGSRIVRALPTRQEILVWTDTNLFTLQFLGTTDVFGLQEYASNITIMSPRAVTVSSDIVYWMGNDKFYSYSGRVETLPCTLLDHVFSNIARDQSDQIVSGTNEEWNEIWWFYPTANSTFNDAYVVYNYSEQSWYYGSLARTSWLSSSLRGRPLATNTVVSGLEDSGYLYIHETGTDDDGAPMTSFVQSSDIDLEDGEKFVLTKRLIPDVNFTGSTATEPEVTMQLLPRNFPGSGYRSDASDTQRVVSTTVDRFTNQVFIRARARQMALRIASEDLGVQWQLGTPRIDGRLDGKR